MLSSLFWFLRSFIKTLNVCCVWCYARHTLGIRHKRQFLPSSVLQSNGLFRIHTASARKEWNYNIASTTHTRTRTPTHHLRFSEMEICFIFLITGCWQLPGRVGHGQAWNQPLPHLSSDDIGTTNSVGLSLKFGSLSLKKIFQELTVWGRAEMIRYRCGSLPVTWRAARTPGAQRSVRVQHGAHSPSAKGHSSGGGQTALSRPSRWLLRKCGKLPVISYSTQENKNHQFKHIGRHPNILPYASTPSQV